MRSSSDVLVGNEISITGTVLLHKNLNNIVTRFAKGTFPHILHTSKQNDVILDYLY